MKLTAVYPEQHPGTYTRWVAVWRLPSGAIHQPLPMTVQNDTKAEATAYAVANPPVWKP